MKKLYFNLVLMVLVTTSFSFVDSKLPQDGDKFFYWLFSMLFFVGIVHLIKTSWQGYLVIRRAVLISKLRKTRTQREKFFYPFSVRHTEKLVALILFLPISASAQGISQLQLDFSFFFVGIVVVAILGIVYFSHPRFSHLWKEWSPVQPKTWLPFLRELWLFNLFEVFCGIVASIATASIGLFFDQKPYSSRFKR